MQDRDSQYHSLQLTLNRRYANGFTVNSNYTLSDLQGTIGGPELVPYFHPDFETIVDTLRYGRLDDMRRHRFVTSWVYDIPGPTEGAAESRDRRMAGDRHLSVAERPAVHHLQRRRQCRLGAGRQSGDSNRPAARSTGDAHLYGTSTIWFNPAAFAVNPNGSFGETLRGEFFGPKPLDRRSRAVQAVPLHGQSQPAVPCGVLQPVQHRELQQSQHDGEHGSDVRPDHRGAGSADHAVRVEVPLLDTTARRTRRYKVRSVRLQPDFGGEGQ